MTDCWADWIRSRRTGGDAEFEAKMLEQLAAVRDKVTIHHLLTHSSGLGSYWNAKYDASWSKIFTVDDFIKTTLIARAKGELAQAGVAED